MEVLASGGRCVRISFVPIACSQGRLFETGSIFQTSSQRRTRWAIIAMPSWAEAAAIHSTATPRVAKTE
jgi:hypothetical protein